MQWPQQRRRTGCRILDDNIRSTILVETKMVRKLEGCYEWCLEHILGSYALEMCKIGRIVFSRSLLIWWYFNHPFKSSICAVQRYHLSLTCKSSLLSMLWCTQFCIQHKLYQRSHISPHTWRTQNVPCIQMHTHHTLYLTIIEDFFHFWFILPFVLSCNARQSCGLN